jgi:hypothetical protein
MEPKVSAERSFLATRDAMRKVLIYQRERRGPLKTGPRTREQDDVVREAIEWARRVREQMRANNRRMRTLLLF